MASQDFRKALRDADRAWADELAPPRIERQLRQRMREQQPAAEERRSFRWRWAALGGGLALAASALLLWWSAATKADFGDFAANAPCPGFEAHVEAGALVVDGGRCELEQPEHGMALSVAGGARLVRTEAGVSVERGRVVFDVAPRPQRRQVTVSGGVIEIVGTRFVVQEQGDHGWVRLEHGAIRFLAPGHAAVMLKPGEQLHWPLDGASATNATDGTQDPDAAQGEAAPQAAESREAAEAVQQQAPADSDHSAASPEDAARAGDPAVASAPRSGASSATATSAQSRRTAAAVASRAASRPHAAAAAASVPAGASAVAVADESPAGGTTAARGAQQGEAAEGLVARVQWLRARGRYGEAARLLQQLDGVKQADRERLSYERGALLTYRLNDHAAACAHWRAHHAAFAGGSYDVEVASAQRWLKCGAP